MTSLAYVYFAATKSDTYLTVGAGPYSKYGFGDVDVLFSPHPFELKQVGRYVTAQKLAIQGSEPWDNVKQMQKEIPLSAGPVCMMFVLDIVETQS